MIEVGRSLLPGSGAAALLPFMSSGLSHAISTITGPIYRPGNCAFYRYCIENIAPSQKVSMHNILNP